MKVAIGIDLGGTNIKALAVTPTGKVLSEAIVPTGDFNGKDWRPNVRRALDLVQRQLGRPADRVGVAAPGLPAKNQRSISFLPSRLKGIEGLVWTKFLRQSHPVPV